MKTNIVEAFAGQPYAQVTHTLILINDSSKVWFKEVGWEFAVKSGMDAEAIFGNLRLRHHIPNSVEDKISREEAAKTISQSLEGNVTSVFMLQDSHFRFARGKNHFSVAVIGLDDEPTPIFEGEEMGDWAMLSGQRAGLVVSCRESARQHPKEFEVFRDKMVLRLFSNRAGEELDFRPETLVEKWNLDLWLSPEERQSVVENESNAVGWSKTHELLLAPICGAEPQSTAARLSQLHSTPVYANVEPLWVWKTEPMGPLYPKDTEGFKEAEQFIAAVFNYWHKRGHEPGFYGFVDYYNLRLRHHSVLVSETNPGPYAGEWKVIWAISGGCVIGIPILYALTFGFFMPAPVTGLSVSLRPELTAPTLIIIWLTGTVPTKRKVFCCTVPVMKLVHLHSSSPALLLADPYNIQSVWFH